ncbi:MAG: hypothetical protein N4A40_08250 [Tissierellales bacterium]|jgi:hypothetical protein|nr:hypothetical protein [Tissierellales bacterium]
MICFIDEQRLKSTYSALFFFLFLLFLLIDGVTLLLHPFSIYNNSILLFCLGLTIISFLLHYLSKQFYFRIKLDESGLHYDYKILNTKCQTIGYDEIESYNCATASTRFIHLSQKRSSKLFIVDGNDLVTLTLKNNEKISLSTKNIDFLIDTLEHYL